MRDGAGIGLVEWIGTGDRGQARAIGNRNLDPVVQGGDAYKEVGFDPVKEVVGLDAGRVWGGVFATTTRRE